MAAEHARPTRKSARKLIGQPVPAFALAPAIAGQGRACLGRPGVGPAAPGQCLRQLVRALHRRGAAAAGAEAPGRADRRDRGARPAGGRRGLPRPPWRSVRADRLRSRKPGAARARFVGVPESFIVDGRGIIRYQHMGPIEPGDVPDDHARVGGGASEAAVASALHCCLRRASAWPTATCRRRAGPTSNCPIRARKPRPRR